MMKLIALLFIGVVFAEGPGAGWTALNGKNVKVIKGGNERCAGGLVSVSTEAGVTTVQLGPLIHFEYKKSGEAKLEPEGSEDCRVERTVTEVADGWRRDVSFSNCEEADDNRSYRETLVLKKKIVSYERVVTAGKVAPVLCRFK